MAISDQTQVVTVTAREKAYLRLGLGQAGGKLPIFDTEGQSISASIVRSCVAKGWAEPWFANPMKPDWLVCKLTPTGRKTVG